VGRHNNNNNHNSDTIDAARGECIRAAILPDILVRALFRRNGSLPRSITLRRCVFDSAASPSSEGGSPGSRSGSDSSPGTHRLTEKPHTPPSPITGPPGTISPVKGGGGTGVDPVLRLLPVFVQMGTDVPPSPAKDAEVSRQYGCVWLV
jgi:hypothetical protein